MLNVPTLLFNGSTMLEWLESHVGGYLTHMFILLFIICGHECFTGKYTTGKIHTKLHLGPEWPIFPILTSEDIDDVISRFFGVVTLNQFVLFCLYRK